MTKIAFVGDIHGYAPALLKALEICQQEGVQSIVGLGDYIDGWDENEKCISLIQEHFHSFVSGNHDVAHDHDLNGEQRAWLKELPERIECFQWLVIHDSPRTEEKIKSAVDAWGCFDDCDFQRCVVGHSHRPMLYRYNPDLVTDCDELDAVGEGVIIEPDRRYLLANPSLAYNMRYEQRPGFAIFDSESHRLRITYVDLPPIIEY
jgi:predicted phosphodiesterase